VGLLLISGLPSPVRSHHETGFSLVSEPPLCRLYVKVPGIPGLRQIRSHHHERIFPLNSGHPAVWTRQPRSGEGRLPEDCATVAPKGARIPPSFVKPFNSGGARWRCRRLRIYRPEPSSPPIPPQGDHFNNPTIDPENSMPLFTYRWLSLQAVRASFRDFFFHPHQSGRLQLRPRSSWTPVLLLLSPSWGKPPTLIPPR